MRERFLAAPEEEKKVTRRRFLTAAAAAAAGAFVADKMDVFGKAGQLKKEQKERELQGKIEKEKITLRELIDNGLKNEREFNELLERYNALIAIKDDFDIEHPEKHEQVNSEIKKLSRRLDDFYVERGTASLGLLAEANPYAERLKEDEAALSALATLRVLYREESDSHHEFPYWHNCALAYLELGKRDQREIIEKFDALIEYAENRKFFVPDVAFEQILYVFVDDDFDFSLDSQKVEIALDTQFPSWRRHQATHENKDSYLRYNDVAALDIIELNRMRRVMSQLWNAGFVDAVFKERDADLKNNVAESGGVIPLPHEKGLRPLASKEPGWNGTYVTPPQQKIEGFVSAATFHFHATEINEPSNVHGPSGGDSAFFAPGVVFTSLDYSTILVHFYSSRALSRVEMKNKVVCLGEIKKPE